MRHYASVQLISGEITQEALLERIEKEKFTLILAPWYLYLKWNKIEAHLGMSRTSGPTIAGYFCEPLQAQEIAERSDHLRAILLDFAHLNALEASKLIECLMTDTKRSGIRPLLKPDCQIYCENWYFGQGLGHRIDSVMALPEIANSEWNLRAGAIRLVLGAFWSLIYEEGPGKSELAQATSVAARSPRAYFQLGSDGLSMVFRLCYTMPSWAPKDVLSHFWPDPTRPTTPVQILLKYADFMRVHAINDCQDVEVVVGLFNSAVSEKAHYQMHTLWIEPLSPSLVSEVPFESPGPNARHLKAMPANPSFPTGATPRSSGQESGEEGSKAKERFIFESATKIRELKTQIGERDELIRDLKAGGVGTSAPLPPVDAEGLLEAFQERYFEARYQIRQFEIQMAELEKRNATPQEIESLRRKMATLAVREQDWLKKLASVLESFRAARKQGTGG